MPRSQPLRNFLRTVFCTALFLQMGVAWGFKVGTHVWIAQNVLNNLEQCERSFGSPCIKIEFLPRSADQFWDALPSESNLVSKILPIPAAVAEAIRTNPEYFRMGNIGPDAFPGIYEGQMLIHPGNEKEQANGTMAKIGFGTGEFMELLLKRAEAVEDPKARNRALAFAYGFLSHAAADTFAHTYVNTYAGDVFSAVDGEQAVETRHMALESYIDQLRPGLVDSEGRSMGEVSELVKDKGKLAVPTSFVRDALIYDAEMQNQFAKTTYMSHLRLVYSLRQKLSGLLCQAGSGVSDEELARDVANQVVADYDATDSEENEHNSALSMQEKLKFPSSETYRAKIKDYIKKARSMASSSGGCAVQQIDVAVLQIVALYYLDIQLSEAEARKILEIKQKLDNIINKGSREILAHSQELEEQQLKLVQYSNRAFAAQTNASIDAIKQLNSIVQKLIKLEQKRLDAESKLNSALFDFQNKSTKFQCDAINNICSPENFEYVEEKVISVACKVAGSVPGTCDVLEKFDCSFLGKVPGLCSKEKCIGSGRFKTCANISVPCMKDEMVSKLCEKTKQVSCMVDGLVDSSCPQVTKQVLINTAAQAACSAEKARCQAEKALFDAGRTLSEDSIKAQRLLYDQVVDEIANLNSSLDKAKDAVKNSTEELNALFADALTLKQGMESNVLDLSLRLGEGLRGIAQGWVNDIDLAMEAYVYANGTAIVNTMDDDKESGLTRPLLDWLTCYGPSIAGVPSPALGVTICAVQNASVRVEKFKKNIERELLKLAPAMVRMWHEKMESEISKLPFRIAEQTQSEFQRALGKNDSNPAFLLHATDKDISEHELDSIFGDDSSGKWLVEYEQMGSRMNDRVRFDMKLNDGESSFDPKSFPPVYNAQVLASLALLNGEGLSRLTALGGVSKPVYQAPGSTNIITGSLRSIDGNHQWLPIAPPHLRKGSATRDAKWKDSAENCQNYWRRYGLNEAENSKFGFKLYSDLEARTKVFERIFLAPLNPSLESPAFTTVKPTDYPFAVNPQHPFGTFTGHAPCGIEQPVAVEEVAVVASPEVAPPTAASFSIHMRGVALSESNQEGNGVAVDLRAPSTSQVQQWTYRQGQIVSSSGRCLAVQGDQLYQDGGRVFLWECNGTPSQTWKFDQGHIVSDAGYCLDVPAGDPSKGVQIWSCSQQPWQQWQVVTPSGGAEDEVFVKADEHDAAGELQNRSIMMAGQALTVKEQRGNGSPLGFEALSAAAAQQWTVDAGQIIHNSGLCLAIQGDQQKQDGGRVFLWECNGTASQMWHVQQARIVSDSGYCLDVAGGDLKNGVQIWSCNNNTWQQFDVK